MRCSCLRFLTLRFVCADIELYMSSIGNFGFTLIINQLFLFISVKMDQGSQSKNRRGKIAAKVLQ
ncbi:hypothetical protein J2W55_000992 [Mucilaginibacter pocheonensis]|uniref:Uncharacterized protein n=1 Tax=Mucilaginibacter pocheonensis TaxID=398050 RepID=A0ABU1T7A3_9SPHI|nr:hypothetical protein [Mucilaginibacter pocheonensis]